MNGQVVVFKGWTALSLASFFGHVKVVKAIVEAKLPAVRPDIYTSSRIRYLNLPCISPFVAAISSIQYLLVYNIFAGPPAMRYIRKILEPRDLLELNRYREGNAHLWLPDTNQENSVPGPSLEERLDILELLLSNIHKFNINEEDSAGFSAVQIAACGSQPEIIRYIQFPFSALEQVHANEGIENS